jgi:hypothetical protein
MYRPDGAKKCGLCWMEAKADPMNLKTALELLDIIDRQNRLIAELVNENFEQENMINVLMQEHIPSE